MTIADMSAINVEVNVDETEISNVEVGQLAKVKVVLLVTRNPGCGIQKNPLAVSSLTPRADFQPGHVQEAKEFKVT